MSELYCLFMRGFGAFSVTVDLYFARAHNANGLKFWISFEKVDLRTSKG